MDYNLDTSICDTDDFSNQVGTCNYDFNIATATDGNYTILFTLTSTSKSDQNTTKEFSIDNRERILIVDTGAVTGVTVKLGAYETKDTNSTGQARFDLNSLLGAIEEDILLEFTKNGYGDKSTTLSLSKYSTHRETVSMTPLSIYFQFYQDGIQTAVDVNLLYPSGTRVNGADGNYWSMTDSLNIELTPFSTGDILTLVIAGSEVVGNEDKNQVFQFPVTSASDQNYNLQLSTTPVDGTLKFQVRNIYGFYVENAQVRLYRMMDGNWWDYQQIYTDNEGLAIFTANKGQMYRLSVSKTGLSDTNRTYPQSHWDLELGLVEQILMRQAELPNFISWIISSTPVPGKVGELNKVIYIQHQSSETIAICYRLYKNDVFNTNYCTDASLSSWNFTLTDELTDYKVDITRSGIKEHTMVWRYDGNAFIDIRDSNFGSLSDQTHENLSILFVFLIIIIAIIVGIFLDKGMDTLFLVSIILAFSIAATGAAFNPDYWGIFGTAIIGIFYYAVSTIRGVFK